MNITILSLFASLLAPVPGKAIEKALTAMAAHKYEKAIDHIESALKHMPKKATNDRGRALCLLGRAHALAKRPAAAAEAFARVAREAPEARCATAARYGRADALRAKGASSEAAIEYAELSADRLGPDRDALTVEWLRGLARRLLARREPAVASAHQIFRTALELEINADRRVSLARESAEALRAHEGHNQSLLGHDVLTWLTGLADRRLFADLVAPAWGVSILESAPVDPETDALRVKLAAEVEGEWGALMRAAFMRRFPESPEAARATVAQAEFLADRLDTAAVPLLEAQGKTSPRASWRLAQLHLDAGRFGKAITVLKAHLQRFPAHTSRGEAELAIDQARLETARRALADQQYAVAVGQYDALVARDPRSQHAPRAAYEAGLAARGLKEKAARTADARWREVIARWPGEPAAREAVAALARSLLYDQNDHTGAMNLLRDWKETSGFDGATLERKRLEGQALAIDGQRRHTPGRDAKLRMVTRNIESVDARIHRVEPEAYLRAGGSPSGLPLLDVGVIAPDRRWSVKVPNFEPGRDVEFELAIPEPDPGIYVVTVSAAEKEASIVVMVSDVTLVARAAGPDLAAAVFRNGEPVSGARILSRVKGKVIVGKTDGTGLYRSRRWGDEVTLLAEYRGAPALLTLNRPHSVAPKAMPSAAVELDRPAYRPGDQLHFRAVCRRGDTPIEGTMRVSVGNGEPKRFETDSARMASGSLTVPIIGWGRRRSGTVPLRVLCPGADGPLDVAQINVQAPSRAVRTVRIDAEGVAWVTEPDGTPAVGVPLVAKGQTEVALVTDAAGGARLPAPPKGHPWTWGVRIAGTRIRASYQRPRPQWPETKMTVECSGRSCRFPVEGQGALTVARLLAQPEPTPPPKDPWVPTVEPRVEGATVWQGHHPEEPTLGSENIVFEKNEVKAAATVELEPGRYVARLVSAGRTVAQRFEVEGALRLQGARDAGLGETLTLRAEGGPAIVTAEAGGILAAAVGSLKLRVRPEMHGAVTLVGTGPTGDVVTRRVQFDGRLAVKVTADEAGRIRAEVRDGTGAPVRARVLLHGLDQAFIDEVGMPAVIKPLSPPGGSTLGGIAGQWIHGAQGEAMSARLLAEKARGREAQLAQRARQGVLQQNAFAEMMEQAETPLAAAMSGSGDFGLGASGSGAGGGRGRLRGHAGAQSSIGGEPVHRGYRGPTPWFVVDTGKDGIAEVDAVWPRSVANWTVFARAMTASSRGMASTTVKAHTRPRLVLPRLAPGRPEDRAPLRVTVVNGSSVVEALVVKANEVEKRIEIPAGEKRVVDFGPHRPGDRVRVELMAGEKTVDTAWWRWALHSVEGVATVAIGPGGGLPMARWALASDPMVTHHVLRAARAGRAALAALPYVADRGPLLARIQLVRSALAVLSNNTTPLEATEILLFLGEAQGAVQITRSEIERWARLRPPGPDPATRVAVLHARAVAGVSVDDASLARLLRGHAALDDETSSRLARVLAHLGRPGPENLIRGHGPHAILARRGQGLRAKDNLAKGRAALLSGAIPAIGSRGRADWIAAIGRKPSSRKGVAKVSVDGRPLGEIDLRTGGVIRVVTTKRPKVVGADDPWIGLGIPEPKGEQTTELTRRPRGVRGTPIATSARLTGKKGFVKCGSPCALAIGDGLLVEGSVDEPGWQPPAGFTLETDSKTMKRYLLAVAHGRFTLPGASGKDGYKAPRIVEVGAVPALGAVSQVFALSLASQALAAGGDALQWLAPWPDDHAWAPEGVGLMTQIRFSTAKDAPTTVDRFEALRDAWPKANIDLSDVARVARAYAEIGAHERSIDVWRAGLGAAFLGETAIVRQVEGRVGTLASLQALRLVAGRYPRINAVGDALFHLPQRLGGMADAALRPELVEAGITATDLRLMAAAWDREYLAEWPKGERRFEVGFHLVRTLLQLGAHARAADWAGLLAATASPLQDGLLYLEGVARAGQRQDSRALRLFERVASEEFPTGDGRKGPAQSRADARFAAAKLHEARGELEAARKGYAAVTASHPDALHARANLTTAVLEPEGLRVIDEDEKARLEVRLANVKTVNLRAYRLDLRTLFLRDGGLAGMRGVKISGVSPVWSGRIQVDAGPFPKKRQLELPLRKAGAYLVQLDGGGRRSTSVLVRSNLELTAEDVGPVRRARVQRNGKPAAGIEVRAIEGGGGVAATKTDLRGVASVNSGSQVLAYAGENYAFTRKPPERSRHRRRRQRKAKKGLGRTIEKRLNEQLRRNTIEFESNFGKKRVNSIDASAL